MGAPRTSRETWMRSGGASPRSIWMWPIIEPRVCCCAVAVTDMPQTAKIIIGRSAEFEVRFRTRTRTPKRVKGLFHTAEQARNITDQSTSRSRLERKLQVELHLAWVQRTACLAKIRKRGVVICAASGCGQQEVGTVQHVKCLPFKFQVGLFCEFENLAQSHVGEPLARPKEL